MSAYYSENDPYPVRWLQNLIQAGHIAPGVVDGRSIESVAAEDVRGATQAHFFAGLGIWSHALRLAGWPDDLEVWTGSCPCQPFSGAGRKRGVDDERHLWPTWFELIEECRPAVIFGEQVASADGLSWLDVVSTDLEGAGYAVGAADLCAAGIGAPHLRQRLFFVAYAAEPGRQPWQRSSVGETKPLRRLKQRSTSARRGEAGELAHTDSERLRVQRLQLQGRQPGRDLFEASRCGEAGELGDADRSGVGQHARELHRDETQHEVGRAHGDHASFDSGPVGVVGDASSARLARRASEPGDDGPQLAPVERAGRPTGGFWSNAVWVPCIDGKWRAAEPEFEPLADGRSEGVGRLCPPRPVWPLSTGEVSRRGRIKGYGNAIVGPVAATFIRAFMEATTESPSRDARQ